MVRGDIQNKAKKKKANTVKIAVHTGRESRTCESKDVMVKYGCQHMFLFTKTQGCLYGSKVPALPHQLILRHTEILLVSYL